MLSVRGISQEFLDPAYDGLADPFLLPDMDALVSRLKLAGTRGERVLIYGDYDVDGVTASAIMREVVLAMGVSEVEVMLPDRFRDGYGMSSRVVERAVNGGFSLVVTVDCGSNNGAVIEELAASGVDVVVTDHHELSNGVPSGALAVVNPKRTDDVATLDEAQIEARASLRELCGAGVAFFVARAAVLQGLIPEGQEKWLLDLAAIGTVCDSMVLTGENRIICKYGLLVLSKTRRVGLSELMRVAHVKTLNTEAIGFQIGPRLNAAGRLRSADLAFELLTTASRARASELALELDRLNSERKKQQTEAMSEIAVGSEPVIVAAGAWHEGVLGIIAGRLTEKYRRPSFVLTEVSGGDYKGSGRSFGDFNLALAVSECSDLLVSGGGHAEACGVRVQAGRLDDFRARVNEYYSRLELRNQERFLEITHDLEISSLAELSLEFTEELAQLEPYGNGNPEPVFLLSPVTVLEASAMGSEGKHLRLLVRDASGTMMKLVAFYAPADWFKIALGSLVDVWINVVANEWNGSRSVEGRIVRILEIE